MHYYKFFIGDYQKKTKGLSLLEHGAYRILMDEYYAKEAPLPDDLNRLYRIAVAVTKADKSAVDHVLETYFTRTNEGYVHAKCDEVIGAANAIAMANSIKGRSGGRGNKRKVEQKPDESPAKATALPEESCGEADANPVDNCEETTRKPPHYLTTSLPQENTNTTPTPPVGAVGGVSRNTQSSRSKKSYRTAEFELWYAVYPRHVGPETAAKALKVALDKIEGRHESREAALEWLMRVTGTYATSDMGQGQYCWHPSTFLNGGHYDDDPSGWNMGTARGGNLYDGIEEARMRREHNQQEVLP